MSHRVVDVDTPASYDFTARPTPSGWQILCRPGPLARFLLSESGSPQYERLDSQLIVAIPLTPDLDRSITQLIDALTDLRYRTGQVQLQLWDDHL